ncbi:serine/arginine repetitive matrix protein 1-like [Pseudophryne corroboree]|uniref:serine/arginine repetitive matrix protein 1-like n=1 Tax=Pseudophryne corroboree TaxID=495146 RepID=UPI003081AFA6
MEQTEPADKEKAVQNAGQRHAHVTDTPTRYPQGPSPLQTDANHRGVSLEFAEVWTPAVLLAFPRRKKNRPEDGRRREKSSPKGGVITYLPRGHHLRAGHHQRADHHLRSRHQQRADHHLRSKHQQRQTSSARKPSPGRQTLAARRKSPARQTSSARRPSPARQTSARRTSPVRQTPSAPTPPAGRKTTLPARRASPARDLSRSSGTVTQEPQEDTTLVDQSPELFESTGLTDETFLGFCDSRADASSHTQEKSPELRTSEAPGAEAPQDGEGKCFVFFWVGGSPFLYSFLTLLLCFFILQIEVPRTSSGFASGIGPYFRPDLLQDESDDEVEVPQPAVSTSCLHKCNWWQTFSKGRIPQMFRG